MITGGGESERGKPLTNNMSPRARVSSATLLHLQHVRTLTSKHGWPTIKINQKHSKTIGQQYTTIADHKKNGDQARADD